jgi:hypothetical protein
VREVAAINASSLPKREAVKDHLVTVAKECWLNNKSSAFTGLALRTSEPHPKVPNGYFLTFSDSKHPLRYVQIHIIPANAPDGGYMVFVDQNSRNAEIDEAIEKAIDRLEAKYDKSWVAERNQPLC